MLGYDYEISYRKESHNATADALSRAKHSTDGQIWQMIAVTVISELLNKVKALYNSMPN